MQVRQGDQADLAWVLQAAGRSGWEQTVPRERPAAQWAAVAQRVDGLVRGALAQPGAQLLMAEAGGVPVGYAIACLQPNPLTGQTEGMVVDVYVEPDRRGQGAARALLAALERHLHDQGARTLAVAASLHGAPALRLVTGLGYWPERVLMVKPLQ